MAKYNTYPLIFAEPRSGSTSLSKICHASHEIDFLNEPFNGINKDWKDRIKSGKESLFYYLKNFDLQNNGFKHCPPNTPRRINNLLLFNSSRILFLERQNIVSQIISWQIADRTNKWHKFLDGSHKSISYSPLNLQEVEKKIGELKKYEKYKKMVKEWEGWDGKTKTFFYEEIFNGGQSPMLKEVYNFLSLDWRLRNKTEVQRWISRKNKILKESEKMKIGNLTKVKSLINSRLK